MNESEIDKNARKNIRKLPPFAFTRLPSTGEVIMVRNGEAGYSPTNGKVPDPDAMNQLLGITKFQVEALVNGSMFGFHIPGADPDYLERMAKS